ncbi:MAG TPA: carboxylesterase/lipase family protein [Acidimicrobiales bacterium]|nr:carboxylesterase/lipase family protein [Acidimicrobiales bacterium]
MVLEVSGGRIAGRREQGVSVFKGIPYAAPPTGQRRWLPPQAVEPWVGVRPAEEYGPSCPQPAERPAGWSQETASAEDCLVLNVWTPAPDDRRRPVMVWYHGGGYAIGSGSWPLYDGTALARRGDVVVVTVNHRLGVLGYLHLAVVGGDDYATSGNAGMLDLVASLEWVQDNIAAFGGDPANVTVFGESGGGAKVSVLHVMPAARGLFHRAVIQSGPSLRVQGPEQAAAQTERLLDALGIPGDSSALERLRDLPVEDLLAAQRKAAPRPGGDGGGVMGGFAPVLDGVSVVQHPGKAMAEGSAIDVPLLIGRNRDEGTMALASDPVLSDPSQLDEEGLRQRLSGFGERADELVAGYRGAYPDADLLDLLIAIRSDAFMGFGTARLAELRLAGGRQPVFMYRFDWASGPLRAAHGYEIAFVFDNVRPPVMQPSASRSTLAERMSEAWLSFARHGDPNHPGLPKWPSYSLDERATMIFDRGDCVVKRDPFDAVRHLWGNR